MATTLNPFNMPQQALEDDDGTSVILDKAREKIINQMSH